MAIYEFQNLIAKIRKHSSDTDRRWRFCRD